MKLPPQPWMDRPGTTAILKALRVEDGNSRIVGGAVRDALLGIEVADVDLATRLPPDEVIARLEAAKVKAVPTGIAHGTVTAVHQHSIIEVTTLRRDVETDGRRATIAFTDDWQEDAARRDFTVNALYADPVSGEIFDYFGGIDDLTARKIRFIGVPLDRIAEDHLRILRFFRFHARFGSAAPDPAGLAACAARAKDLMALSRERIRDEILKLLGVADPVATVRLMLDHRILAPVLPEITSATALDTLVTREREAGVPGDAIRRLAALLPRDTAAAALADDIAVRLKLSNAERKRLVAIAGAGTDQDEPAERLAYRLGTQIAVDRLLLGTLPAAQAARIAQWPVPRFPLKGGELVARKLAKGPEVSRMLRRIEEDWIAAGFPIDPATVEQLVHKNSV